MIASIFILMLAILALSITFWVSGLFPLGAMDYPFVVTIALLILYSLHIIVRSIRNLNKLKSAGWKIALDGDILWTFTLAHLNMDESLITQEEFQATPMYDASLSDLENLRNCLKTMKEAKIEKQR